MQTYALAEGVSAAFIPTTQFRSTLLSVSFYFPLQADYACENAMLPYLLAGQSPSYPDFSTLNRRLDMLYGAALSVGTEKLGDFCEVNLKINAINSEYAHGTPAVAQAAAFLRGLIFERFEVDYGFHPDEIAREKRLLAEAIAGEINEKRRLALSCCIEAMCQGEPYGLSRLGLAEQVEKVTAQRLQTAYTQMLRTALVQIRVIGNALPDGILEEFTRGFAAVGRNYAPFAGDIVKPAGALKQVERRMDIKQGKLVLGLRSTTAGGDDATLPTYVMCDLLGGGPYSRLFANVREKLQLCYYCAARAVRRKGVMVIDSGIEAENREQAQAAILAELSAIAKGEFTAEQLATSIRSLSDSLKGVKDDADLIDKYYSARFSEPAPLSPEEFVQKLQGVTADQVAKAAAGFGLDTVFVLLPQGQEVQ